jgi:hypothetical protein
LGVDTDFIGHIAIEPPLNDAEQQYVTAFSASRRCYRAGGPYTVPFNPAAEDADLAHGGDEINQVAEGQPSLWCHWVPAWDGSVLSYDGTEKFYAATAWLQYLIEHFFRPGACASRTGLDWFEEFTFDHQLNGVVAAYPHDALELYLIRVDANVVTQDLVARSSSPAVDRGPLPYQAVRAAQRARRRRPRPNRFRPTV